MTVRSRIDGFRRADGPARRDCVELCASHLDRTLGDDLEIIMFVAPMTNRQRSLTGVFVAVPHFFVYAACQSSTTEIDVASFDIGRLWNVKDSLEAKHIALTLTPPRTEPVEFLLYPGDREMGSFITDTINTLTIENRKRVARRTVKDSDAGRA